MHVLFVFHRTVIIIFPIHNISVSDWVSTLLNGTCNFSILKGFFGVVYKESFSPMQKPLFHTYHNS